MASTSRDQFDDIPDSLTRVGAHRAPAKRGRGWVRFAWAALATGILVVVGLFALSRLNPVLDLKLPNLAGGGSSSATPTVSATPTAAPVTDPAKVDPALNLSISVFKRHTTDGLQDKAGDAIKAARDGRIRPAPTRRPATRRPRRSTTRTPSTRASPVAWPNLLGVGVVQLSDAYPGRPGDDRARRGLPPRLITARAIGAGKATGVLRPCLILVDSCSPAPFRLLPPRSATLRSP